MGDWLFSQSKLQEITIPKNVTSIAAGFCSGCYDLQNITFEGSVPDVTNGIFGWGSPHQEVMIYYLGNDGEAEKLENILQNADPWGHTTPTTLLQMYRPNSYGGMDLLDENKRVFKSLDANGNLLKTYEYDLSGNLIAEYDKDGNLLSSYSYKFDGAGNLTAAYKNGIATYKKTLYTPAEAAAAIRKGNNNKVTLTFK